MKQILCGSGEGVIRLSDDDEVELLYELLGWQHG